MPPDHLEPVRNGTHAEDSDLIVHDSRIEEDKQTVAVLKEADAHIGKLQRQLEAAKEGLKWYAYVNYYKHDPSSHTYPVDIIDTDQGQVARGCLAHIDAIGKEEG